MPLLGFLGEVLPGPPLVSNAVRLLVRSIKLTHYEKEEDHHTTYTVYTTSTSGRGRQQSGDTSHSKVGTCVC